MIASRKLAGIAFLGGAALALLSGCAAEQSPSSYYYQPPAAYQPVPMGSAEVMARYRAYLEQQQRAYSEQENARAWLYQPENAPVTQAAPRRGRRHYSPDDDDGPVISDNPPRSPEPVPQAPDDADCVGWWRLCRIL
jgi:hypothetical protein